MSFELKDCKSNIRHILKDGLDVFVLKKVYFLCMLFHLLLQSNLNAKQELKFLILAAIAHGKKEIYRPFPKI
jgi:hypothetical protein